MDINQNIRKKITSQQISLKNVNTSFLMLPLRLETKFVDKKPLCLEHEPERVYHVLEKVWRIIEHRKGGVDQVKALIRDLHHGIDELDVLYKEDRSILLGVLAMLKNILPAEAEVRDDWDCLVAKVERVGSVDSMKSNPATALLDRMEHYTRRMRVLSRRPPYNGKRRQSNAAEFSQTAKYKAAYKHLKQCVAFFGRLGNELGEIPALNQAQKDKMNKLLLEWEKGIKLRGYDIYNGAVNDEKTVLRSVRDAKRNLDELVKRVNPGIIDDYKMYRTRIASVRTESVLRYTTVVGIAMRYVIKATMKGAGIDVKQHLARILGRTYYTYIEQYQFVETLVGYLKSNYNQTVTLTKPRNFTRLGSLSRTRAVNSLCVRIYPDDVAVTQMLRGLSKNEYLIGRDFWLKYIFNADEQVRHSLWLGVCDYFPPYRAAWIVKRTFPEEHYKLLCKRAGDFRLEGRAFEDFFAEVEENILNVFPMTYVDTDEREFTVPTTDLLPDRFVLHAELKVREGKTITISRYGHKLPHTLQLGLDMNDLENAAEETSGHVSLKGNLRWMTDYDEAEKMGMAITLPLESFEFQRGDGAKKGQRTPRDFVFNSLYVLGVNEESESECEKILTGLLEAHMYSSDGYDLVKIGTPTNILSKEDEACFDTSDEALVEKYGHQARNCVSPSRLSEREDMNLIRQLFALKHSVLANLKGPDEAQSSQEVNKSRMVNNILVDIVDNKLVSLFRRNQALREFLVNDVLPRGSFPPVRIGSQPYGILPICDFRRLTPEGDRSIRAIKEILVYLTEKWNDVADGITQYNGERQSADDFLDVVGSTPVSSYFQKVTYVKQKGEFLLKPSYFKFGDSKANEGEELIQAILKILKDNNISAGKSSVTDYMDGYDQIPLIEDESSKDMGLSGNVDNLSFPVLTMEVMRRMGGVKITEEEVRTMILEFFDLFSYRLDAWMMGLLNHKLRNRIRRGSHKVALGTFGWVFNLRQKRNDPADSKERDEYILAPSVNHAVTAAVMRSAHKNGAENGDYNMDVRLTSQRVRCAIRIIEGIQNGLALGTILGTDMERMMHESYRKGAELDEGIYKLRKRYPMVESGASEEADDNDITVINGLSLLNDVKRGQFSYDGIFSNNRQEKERALKLIIERVREEYDSLTDVVLSEAVYKLTQGQREAVDGLIQALNAEKNIPMPEVTEIPLASAQVDGNLVVALDPTAETMETALLARVEPKVEQWLQAVIGTTGNVSLQKVASDGRTIEWVTLRELGVSASELVYLSSSKEQFVKYLTLKNWYDTGDKAVLSTDRSDADSLSYDCVEMTLDNLRDMITKAHPLKNSDLVKETGMDDEARYATMQDMYDKTHETISILCGNLRRVLDDPYVRHLLETEDTGAAVPNGVIREAVKLATECYAAGHATALDSVDLAMVVDGDGKFDDPQSFYEAVRKQRIFFRNMANVARDMEEKVAKAAETVACAEDKGYDTYIGAIRKMLVGNMLIVPSFRPDGNVPLGLLDAQKDPGYFTGTGGLEKKNKAKKVNVKGYINEMSKVSEQMMCMQQVRMFQLFNGIEPQDAAPMQIPVNEVGGKRMWLGGEVESEDFVYDANTYLVFQPDNLPAADAEQPLIAAVVFDHWIERIPYRDQTAGLSFYYDQPDAEAPQTLLMAVSTKEGARNHWSEEMLLRTIRSTMHLVKSRAVEPDHLREHPWTSAVFPLISYEDKKIK